VSWRSSSRRPRGRTGRAEGMNLRRTLARLQARGIDRIRTGITAVTGRHVGPLHHNPHATKGTEWPGRWFTRIADTVTPRPESSRGALERSSAPLEDSGRGVTGPNLFRERPSLGGRPRVTRTAMPTFSWRDRWQGPGGA